MKSNKNGMEIDFFIKFKFKLRNVIFLKNLEIFFKKIVNRKKRHFCYYRLNFSKSFRSIQGKLIFALNFSSNFTLDTDTFGKKILFLRKISLLAKVAFFVIF